MQYGELNHNCRLSDEDVELIRALAEERRRLLKEASQLTYREIAKKFGISRGYVGHIVNGRWR